MMKNSTTAFSWIPPWIKARLIELATVVMGGLLILMIGQLWSLPNNFEAHKADVRLELSEHRTDFSELRTDFSELRADFAQFKLEVGDLINVLKVQNAEIKAQNSVMMAQLTELKEQNARSEAQNAQIMAQLQEMREANNRLNARLDERDTVILTLVERSTNNTARIDAIGEELKRLAAADGGN